MAFGPEHPKWDQNHRFTYPPKQNDDDVRSADVLNNLTWKTLETRCFHTKATLMYKILHDLSAPQLSNSFVKLNDTSINYNLRNIEIDLALSRPYTNFLKRSLSIVVQCSGTIFPMRQRPHNRFRISNTNLPPRPPCLLLDRTDSMWYTVGIKVYRVCSIHVYFKCFEPRP